jgi:hypothetical protein
MKRTRGGLVASLALVLTSLLGAVPASAQGHTYSCTITYTNRNGVAQTDTFITGSPKLIAYVESHGGTCTPSSPGHGPG